MKKQMNPLQIHGLETDGVRRLHLRRACNNDMFLQLVGGGRTPESYESILAQIKKVERNLVKAQAKLKDYKMKLIDFKTAKDKIHDKYLEKLRKCKEGDSTCTRKVDAWKKKKMERYTQLRKPVQRKIRRYNQKISDLQDQLSGLAAQQLHREVNLSTRPRRDSRLLNIDYSHVKNRFGQLGDQITLEEANIKSSHYDW